MANNTNNTNLIRKYLENRGYTTVAPEFYTNMVQWDAWYRGYYSPFHDYRQYNGNKFVKKRRLSLGMAKKVCEDHASLLMNEKVSIVVDDSFQTILDDVLKANKFQLNANQLVERAYSLGTGALVEFLDTDSSVTIDYIRGDMIFPISWGNAGITECAFGSLVKIKGVQKLYVNLHLLDDQGNYVIENHTIAEIKDSKQIEETDVEGVEALINTNSPTPRFQIIKPNIINNVDYQTYNNPMGIPVFANSMDVLHAIDYIWDSYINEFRLGKKRVFVPISMTRIMTDEQGVTRPIFDDNDTEFYGVSDESMKDKEGLKDISPDIRHEAHEVAIQRALNVLSDKCGLGTDRYQFTRDGVKTATEVISEKSDLYKNMCKNEIILEDAITGMINSIAELLGKSVSSISVNFDDSIIEDTQTISNRAMVEFNAGLIDAVEYFMRVYKLEEKQAIEMVAKIEKRKLAAAPEPVNEEDDDEGAAAGEEDPPEKDNEEDKPEEEPVEE